jgi:hypothetical protein
MKPGEHVSNQINVKLRWDMKRGINQAIKILPRYRIKVKVQSPSTSPIILWQAEADMKIAHPALGGREQ